MKWAFSFLSFVIWHFFVVLLLFVATTTTKLQAAKANSRSFRELHNNNNNNYADKRQTTKKSNEKTGYIPTTKNKPSMELKYLIAVEMSNQLWLSSAKSHSGMNSSGDVGDLTRRRRRFHRYCCCCCCWSTLTYRW